MNQAMASQQPHHRALQAQEVLGVHCSNRIWWLRWLLMLPASVKHSHPKLTLRPIWSEGYFLIPSGCWIRLLISMAKAQWGVWTSIFKKQLGRDVMDKDESNSVPFLWTECTLFFRKEANLLRSSFYRSPLSLTQNLISRFTWETANLLTSKCVESYTFLSMEWFLQFQLKYPIAQSINLLWDCFRPE